MRVDVRVDAAQHEAIVRLLDKIGNLLSRDFLMEVWPRAFKKYAEVVTDQFEGAYGWHGLSKVTRAQRESLYQGEPGWFNKERTPVLPMRPILVREGFLQRSLTELDMGRTTGYVRVQGPPDVEYAPFTTGNYVNMLEGGPDKWTLAFGTMDPRFEELNAYRPMIPERKTDWQEKQRQLADDLFPLIQQRTAPDA